MTCVRSTLFESSRLSFLTSRTIERSGKIVADTSLSSLRTIWIEQKTSPMITRKRGRLEGSCSNAMSPGPTQESAASHSSPESDVNEWGLSDLFNTDFGWALDDDDPLVDVGMQGLGELEHLEDQASDVSHGRASSRRHTLREMSGQINKNALAARMNRLKKKEYLTGLEQRAGALTAENRLLKQENGNLTKRVEELENETRYLRAVLANESMLAQLLSRLSGVNGLKFSTSLFQESHENDHDYAMPSKRMKVHDQQAAGGVCLHVDKDHVSVEFCTKCAESASASLKM